MHRSPSFLSHYRSILVTLSLLAGAGCAPVEGSASENLPESASPSLDEVVDAPPPEVAASLATRSLLAGPTAGMVTSGRTDASFTRLPDGRVLIAGGFIYGYGTDNVTNTAEVFDPATNTFSAVASMQGPRYDHNATLLADGRVFVVSGWGQSFPEIYDPATNTWTQHPDIPPWGSGGDNVKAAGLPSGRVLVTQGGTAMIFDPATDTYTNIPSCPHACPPVEFITLPDGRIFAANGASVADFFDPATETWSSTSQRTAPGATVGVDLLPDGKVYTWGSGSGPGTGEVYDPATDTWTPRSGIPAGLGSWYGVSTGAPLPNGQFLVPTNGALNVRTELPPAISLNTSEPASSWWMTIATPLLDGRVLVTGSGFGQVFSLPKVSVEPTALVSSGAGSANTKLILTDNDFDGIDDLVVLSSTGVHSLLSNADGTFRNVLRYSAGTTPVAIDLGNFDYWDTTDLAVANRDSDNVTVRLGRGDGTFRMAYHWPAGDAPEDLVIGDFDGDGRNDIAVVGGAGSPQVNFLRGNWDNNFQAPVAYSISVPGAAHIARGDFNADGRMDVAVASGTEATGTMVVLLQQSNGTLLASSTFSAGSRVAGLAAGDLDGDGIADLAVTGGARAYLKGNGDGTFQAAVTVSAVSGDNDLALRDLDADGDLDIVTSNGTMNSAAILRNNGNGTFQPASVIDIGDVGPTAIAAGNVDGNGQGDIVVTSARFGYHVLRGDSNSDFLPRQDAPFGIGVNALSAADFNGDGHKDIVAVNESSRNATVFFNGPSGLTGQIANVATGGDLLMASATGDFNGDGKQDLVVCARTSRTVHVALGNGDGTFQPAVTYTSATAWEPMDVKVADLDGDQDLDLAVAGYSGKGVFVMSNNGNGSFQAPVRFSTGSWTPRGIALADVNNDGKLDALTANYTGSNVSVLLGNGSGGFGAATSYTSAGFLRGWTIAARDLNVDGYVDIVVGTYESNDIRVFLGNAQGTFTASATTYSLGESVRSVAVDDLTGDGIPDLAAVTSTTSALHVYKGVGNGTFLPKETTAVGRSARGVLATDLNGDGRIDIVVASQGSNQVASFYNATY